jgi:phosphoribosylformylglycinamidine synthase subunit PurQ / glutaminase
VRIAIYAPGAPLEGEVVVVPAGLGQAPAPGALDPLRAHARAGGMLLGLGDGVAWLCAAALLPGAVSMGPCATHVRVEGRATAFTWAIPAGRILALPAAGEGARYVASDAEVVDLGAHGRVVMRYCDAAGGLVRPSTGAHASTVAGISDASGRVVGLLAPTGPTLDDELGRQLVTCLRQGRAAALSS